MNLSTRTNKLLFTSLFTFAIGLEIGGFQAVIREISAEFSLTTLTMGLLVAAQYLCVITLPAFIGKIADQRGKKPLLLIFMVIFTTGNLVVALAHHLIAIIIGFTLLGAGYSVGESIVCALISDHFNEDGQRYINLSQAFLCLGAVIAPAVSTLLLPLWRWVFFSSAIICVLATLLLLVQTDFVIILAPPSKTLLDFSIFRSTPFLMFFLSMLVYVGLENGFGYFTEIHFYELFASDQGPLALSLYWGAMALSRFVSALSTKDMYTSLNRHFFVSAIVFAALAISRNMTLSLALCVAIGYSFGPIWSFIIKLASDLFPLQSAQVIGMLSSGCGLGATLFPPIMGAIVTFAPIGTGYVFLAIAAIGGWSFILRSRSNTVMMDSTKTS